MTMTSLNEQTFERITTFGKELARTDYADGYNVGTVVTYDVGWSMSLPKFALIIRRTPKMIETVVLPTTKESTDGYGFQGHERPVTRVMVPEGVKGRRTRMGKGGDSALTDTTPKSGKANPAGTTTSTKQGRTTR